MGCYFIRNFFRHGRSDDELATFVTEVAIELSSAGDMPELMRSHVLHPGEGQVMW